VLSANNVLLVHGAWHGAWCWSRLLDPLRASGLRPSAIDLPGHGDSALPFGDLRGDADAVTAHLDKIDGPTLLVGHSYGGMVITDAGAHDGVVGLVYVCAYLPAAGQTLMDAGGAQLGRAAEAVGSDLAACARLTEDGSSVFLDGDGLAGALYADCDAEVQRWAVDRLGHQPMASFTQAPRLIAWSLKPTTYVVCTEDRAIPPWLQRRMAVNAGHVVELTASHSPFLSVPDELAQVLATAATTTP
jgi:pimeloyl-ACP methyl ester carboxylesterase